MKEGLDVSFWQGRIDWPAVAAAGKRFAIVRSGDGGFFDPLFEENISRAVNAGLIVEPYHYMRFALQPDVHADILWHRLEVAKYLGARPRMWLDWEDPSQSCTGMMLDGRLDWLLELFDSLDGVGFGHYTRASWFNCWLEGAAAWPDFSEHPLWIAHYEAQQPTLPWGWDNWLIWQYTSKGRCPGIEGDVDLNVAQDSFLKEEGVTDLEWLLAWQRHERNFAHVQTAYHLAEAAHQAWKESWPYSEEEKADPDRDFRETEAFVAMIEALAALDAAITLYREKEMDWRR